MPPMLTSLNSRFTVGGMTNPNTSDSPRFMTTEEVADLVRRPTSTIRYWRHLGIGPQGVKVGRRVLYSSDAVESWLALATQQEVEASRARGIA
jgi:hypothetical protein